ncbi:MAG: inositol monophosphatase [Pseudonocardiales bacterium]|nr:inositol monophosphatase [Pseudonocardiales bacterium]
MRDDLALAAELVHAAGLLAARMRLDGVSSSRKTSVSDIVTAADHAAEALVVERLSFERPDDGIVGEEGANVAGDRTWFIDPVDGTYNYASGLPTWCSAAALAHGADLLLGAVYHPSADELWLGGHENPTTCNGVPVTPLPDRPLGDVSIASYLHPTSLPDPDVREPFLRVVQEAATVRMLGSGSVELAAVAGGRLGVYFQSDCLDWDWLPGRALVEAAGGATRVIELRGHRWHVAGNRQTVAEVVALLIG